MCHIFIKIGIPDHLRFPEFDLLNTYNDTSELELNIVHHSTGELDRSFAHYVCGSVIV